MARSLPAMALNCRELKDYQKTRGLASIAAYIIDIYILYPYGRVSLHLLKLVKDAQHQLRWQVLDKFQ